jgi:A-macroglobulin TED domain/Alpha-2-macroglobulin family/Alpha-2-macroglobulin bait region domain/MG2 domain/A-macroglobulin receptor binding domain/Macroglobulin domain MG3
MSRLRVLFLLALAGLFAVVLVSCEAGTPDSTATSSTTEAFQDDEVDGYVALVPRVLRSGETASFSFTLFKGDDSARSHVTVSVLDGDTTIASATGGIDGKGTVTMELPVVTPGDYKVKVEGTGFAGTTDVQVKASTLLFLETDKPIYKPGQTMQIRLVALDSELRPVQTEATVEIQDAKGIKLSKQTLTTDEYGTVTTELPISSEPNLGVWKLTAYAGDTTTELDVRVEKYVLPKYDVTVELTKDWFLVNEEITGHVSSTYSYGRAVQGELKVRALRYVGEWEEYATYTAPIDGEGDFTIDPAEWVAGVAEAGGMGNVQLDISVVEEATGYEQQTTELVTVAASAVNLQLIAESTAFKPTLPFAMVLVTETPGGEPVEASVDVEVWYTDEDWMDVGHETKRVETSRGTAMVTFTPPEDAVRMSITAYSGDAYAWKELTTSYSPSGSFIHVQQTSSPAVAVGDVVSFDVLSTAEAGTFYYEVVSLDRVVFTGSTSDEISFTVTPAMAPSSKLLVYQILPNSEVAADSLPFDVQGVYPQEVTASFTDTEVEPGDTVQVQVQTEGPAKVGLVAVDHSVFILAENHLNLAQVFAELEALYMQPQAELHEAEWMGGTIVIPGAAETFEDAGLIVLTDKRIPKGKELESQVMFEAMGAGLGGEDVMEEAATATTAAPAGITAPRDESTGLAEVERVRQYFPETWIWDETITDQNGSASLTYEAPDSITTWDLRAVALSPQNGLGIAEASLTVFQPFFLQADLPYSVIRGEEIPVQIALYNYLDTPQEIQVELKEAEWFELLDDSVKTVTVAGGDVGSAEFKIKPKTIGNQLVEVSARSSDAADAVIKSIIVEPEGVSRETVENAVLPAGQSRALSLLLPDLGVVSDSTRAYVAVTGSLLAQTIEGLDQLLQMPFGCGEQNMILFAPDTYILKYLDETRQLKPEIQAKAEMLLVTGYQRELTYQHTDGSFSAFGDQDESGSLWLTAFVLKCFSQAKDLTFVDEAVLDQASTWITDHQQADGSFEAVGFVCHEDMMGGVQGKDTLTAYVAIALLEAGQTAAANKAIDYLEGRLDDTEDPYALALLTYALELGGSDQAADAMEKLMAAAIEDEFGLHWSSGGGGLEEPIEPFEPGPRIGEAVEDIYMPGLLPNLDIEATGYATLALIAADDRVNAAQAAKWLVGQRNSQGGFGTTQDTVVALQALIEFATSAESDTELTVTITAGDETQEVQITPENYDVTQVVEIPAGEDVEVEAEGKGEAVIQGVLRYNLLEPEETQSVFDISVDYDTDQVEVDDTIDVNVTIAFNPPEPVKANMTVLDISVPTGFAAVGESLEALLNDPNVKRYDVAGRKVIVYIEDMEPGDEVSFAFQAVALYPVTGKGAPSSVYSYYTPEWRGETLSEALTVQ